MRWNTDREQKSKNPHNEGEQGNRSDKDEPEPYEKEDLLIEEVDWEGALNAIPLCVSHKTDLRTRTKNTWTNWIGQHMWTCIVISQIYSLTNMPLPI